MFNCIIVILFGVIGVIYGSAMDRIGKVEAKIEELNPVFLQIQKDISDINSRLSGIETNISWLIKR